MATKHPKIIMLGQFPPSSGGIASNIQHLLDSPLKEKYDFLLFQTGSRKYGTLKYEYEKLYTKLYRTAKSLFYYIFFLFKHSANIIHINTSFRQYSFWRDLLYVLIARLARIKVLLQIHGGVLDDFLEGKSHVLKSLIKKLLKIPEQVIVLSSMQKKVFKNLDMQQKVRVVPNIIDTSKFNKNRNLRKSLEIPLDSFVVLFVASHFFKEKGVWEIIEAIPSVVKKHKKVLFILVGGGNEEMAIKRACIEKGLQRSVWFMGHLFGEELINIYLASDLFILPTYTEGFPLVILEGMAAGLPIISTPVGAVPEIVKNGVNGFLIPPKDPLALAEKIIKLIENRPLRIEMANRNKDKVEKNYALKPVSKIFDNIYQEVISGPCVKECSFQDY